MSPIQEVPVRRFTDPILFLALFVLDALAWVVVAATGPLASADPGRIAPMAVGTVVVIAAPALAVAALMALARSLTGARPRSFYSWLLAGAVVSALVTGLAGALTSAQGVEVGLGWMTWFFGIEAVAFVIALVVALTGGIPTPVRPTTPVEEVGAPPSSTEVPPRATPGAQDSPAATDAVDGAAAGDPTPGGDGATGGDTDTPTADPRR